MAGHIKPIGGEFWFDVKLFDNEFNNFKDLNAVFLSGGQSAIQFIIEDINFKDNEYILLPSYLCPTILYNFQRKNIKFMFYEINEDLSINLEDIENKTNKYKVKALFFIDYFGFYHSNRIIEFLKVIQQTGVILIEDAVQMLWFGRMKKFIGNYVFNSYRKFLPIDGAIVLCNKSINFNVIKDSYYSLIKEARVKKTEYVTFNIGNEKNFLNLFNMADKAYYERKNINGISDEYKKFLNKVNYKLIKQSRIDNYNYIYDRLKSFSDVKILFHKELIKDNVPLGFPILINNRDFVRNELRKYSIYCPVHWDIRKENWTNAFNESKKLSNCILTIPIDWRYNKEDIEYFLGKFISIV